MARVALIPARVGSRGIPQKNFRELVPGVTPLSLAVDVASQVGVDRIVVTTDHRGWTDPRVIVVSRPAELADGEGPMIDVLIHALKTVRGSPDDQIVLLQPTQILRTVEHVRKAMNTARTLTPGFGLLTVVEVPEIYRKTFEVQNEYALIPIRWCRYGTGIPRQQAPARYLADGTAYVASRAMIENHRTLFGARCYAQIMNPTETCHLDTMEDWEAAVTLFKQRWSS